jgi:hypothetical protein
MASRTAGELSFEKGIVCHRRFNNHTGSELAAVYLFPSGLGSVVVYLGKALEVAKQKFAAAEVNLAAFLNVHRAWLEHGKSHRW